MKITIDLEEFEEMKYLCELHLYSDPEGDYIKVKALTKNKRQVTYKILENEGNPIVTIND